MTTEQESTTTTGATGFACPLPEETSVAALRLLLLRAWWHLDKVRLIDRLNGHAGVLSDIQQLLEAEGV